MSQEGFGSEVSELSIEQQRVDGVSFDPEHITLEGSYTDQISAYRARRVWVSTLTESFLLEIDHDFKLKVEMNSESARYFLRCEFLTACARYAFWRLTNNQAPEAQYIIETAHIPNSETRQEDFWRTPDLKAKGKENQQLAEYYLTSIQTEQHGVLATIKRLIDKIKS